MNLYFIFNQKISEFKNKYIFKLNLENNPINKSKCISDISTFNKIQISWVILNKGIQFKFIDYKNNIKLEHPHKY